MSLGHIVWAMGAEGLLPEAKLVLILVANGGDMDGRYFEPFDRLAAQANVTPDYLVEIVGDLTNCGVAAFSMAPHPITGEMKRCIQMLGGAL